jgi:hypothetical protein
MINRISSIFNHENFTETDKLQKQFSVQGKR